MENKTGIKKRYLLVKGDRMERYFQQGEAFKDVWHDIHADLASVPLFEPHVQKWIPGFVYKASLYGLGHKYLKLHKKYLTHFPTGNIYDQFEALSQGFNRSLASVYGLNSFEALSSELPYHLGCSSMIFPQENSKEKSPIHAYNHDFPDAFGPYLYVRESHPDEGYRSLILTYPNLIGGICGVNEKGLSISLNHAYCTDRNDKPALFFTALLKECLHNCASVSESLKLIKKVDVPNGSMLTMTDLTGRRLTIEMSATKKSVREKKTGILVTFNRFLKQDMQDVQIPLHAHGKWTFKGRLIHDHNFGREKSLEKILKPQSKYAIKDVQQLLSDHNGGEGDFDTICRHHLETSSTLASVIMLPKERTMKVIFGLPCEHRYQTFTL